MVIVPFIKININHLFMIDEMLFVQELWNIVVDYRPIPIKYNFSFIY